jgi:hypothetical protein
VTSEQRHPSVPDQGGHPAGHRRKAIPAAGQLDRGPVDVTNLAVNKRDGTIVLDPQVPGGYVISLNEHGATTLSDLLTRWLQ